MTGRPDLGAQDAVKRLALAALGAVALTAERADELAESLAQRGGMNKDEARAWIDEATTRWRGDAVRVGERAGATMHGAGTVLRRGRLAGFAEARLSIGGKLVGIGMFSFRS